MLFVQLVSHQAVKFLSSEDGVPLIITIYHQAIDDIVRIIVFAFLIIVNHRLALRTDKMP